MQGKIRKLFPGANTSEGACPLFDYIIPENVKRIFSLKGGPGVGKSSLMKKIAHEFADKGYDVEVFFCTSDPGSLDGLVIKQLGIVMLDGTAPHIVDPKNPGAVDEIINLGEYWNLEGMEKNKVEIIECNAGIGKLFKRAFKFLKSAEQMYKDIEEKYSECMDFGKVNLMTEEFIDELFKDVKNTGICKEARHLYGTAITPIGHLDYTDSILMDAEKIYYLDGEIGTGKTTFLKKIADKAIEKGLKVEIFHYPLVKEKIETILITDLKIGITISDLFKDKDKINLNQYMDEDKLAKYEEDIEFDKDIFDEMVNYAISNIKRAKAQHDVLETYYVPNMRFDEIEELKNNLVNRIMAYENK